MSENKETFTEKKSTRRNFLKNSGLTLGGIVLGGAVTSLVVKNNDGETTVADSHSSHGAETSNFNRALMFFNIEQFLTVEAAAEQIFPKDENGPGAKELLVGYYIDHQLAGGFGSNAKEFRQGPFLKGEPTQGNQSAILNKDLFTMGVAALDAEAFKLAEKKFYELEEEKQIELLQKFEADEVALNGATSKQFFNLLKKLTIEGVYADPLYGGNANLEGWKMKRYPGSQMSYVNIIEKDEFVEMEPKSLSDHQ
ncbi:oxidoreductase [Lysinibacillus sp. PLM2]|nr:oxidoreductase [Lysinibacillus sp. PLM2]